jgi:hypothetical protein
MASPHTDPLLGAAGVVAVAGGAFMTVKGFEQGKTAQSLWANIWFDLGLALLLLGLAIVAFALYLHFRKPRGATPSAAVPGSATFRGVDIGGRSRLNVDSSAADLAVDTRIGDDAQMTARHHPGRPDLSADK